MNIYVSYGLYILLVLLPIIFYRQVLALFGVIIIPDNEVGIVIKKFVLFGNNKTLPDGKLVALNGEAGIQADTLPPGIHIGYWPWQYEVRKEKFLVIPDGQIGTIEANDGLPLGSGRVLARSVACDSFQDARAFLTNHGERGRQIATIAPGTYRINTALFDIKCTSATDIPDNKIGIVTVKEGKALPTGEIAGGEIVAHEMFQDGQSFLDHGGYKGLQEQVILAGRYFINPFFAAVECVDLTMVPIAHVGVVISYVGEPGQDVTGDTFRHGNLVPKGNRGVWVEPLDPGRYPINPKTHRVETVPTANVVLNWATGKTEAHRLDQNLSTITVRSSDGFTFNLDVSQIIHIPRTEAPKVIARFGSIQNLVTQVLEPTIGNYFRNAAQESDVIQFLQKRSERQQAARESIASALSDYNVGAVDTLIGDIVPPDALMKTLTDRKIANQEKETFAIQEAAETSRQKLEQARALATTQSRVVDAERSVQVAEFTAQADVKKAEGAATAQVRTAEGNASAKRMLAEADAHVIRQVGLAEAEKINAIGKAEADVIRLKIDSIEPENYTSIEVMRSVAASAQRLVPEIMTGNSTSGTLVDVLVGTILQKHLVTTHGSSKTPEIVSLPTAKEKRKE